jgi:ABC-type phosphate transport system substrate-binding protein
MNNVILRAAVAAVLAGAASTAANANSYSINISGASAQRPLWEGDLQQIAGGTFTTNADANSKAVCTLTKTSAQLSPAIPDIHSLTCTVSTAPATTTALPTGVAQGDVITLNYEAEFGSVWGISPFVANDNASVGRRTITCAGVTGYSRDQDTASACMSANPVAIDIGVSDAEPILWQSQDNWSYSDGLVTTAPDGTGTNNVINILSIPGQGQPNLAQLEAVEANWTPINGEVFTIVVEPTTFPTKGITNLSTSSLRSIFTGKYKTWSQVPELAGSGITNLSSSIVVCRRDHGSGSEVTTSRYLTLNECGGNNGINGGGTAAGAAPRLVSLATSPLGKLTNSLDQTVGTVDGINSNPVENYSTGDIKACLAANPGVSIGLAVLSPSSSYTTLKIDGVEANAHNAALGQYQLYSEDWGFDNSANSQGGTASAIAGRLITDVTKTGGVLPTENGAFGTGGGSWVAAGTTSGQVTNFDLQNGGTGAHNTIPTVASSTETGNPSIPTAVWLNTSKAACTILTNNNH